MTLAPSPIVCLPEPLRLAEPPRYRIEWREDGQARLVRLFDDGRVVVVEDWWYPEWAIFRLSQVRGHG